MNSSPHNLLDDRYQLGKEIGRGSMGVIYEAQDTQRGNQKVAVKIMSQSLTTHQEFREAFRQEAETVATFKHHHIVPVYHYNTEKTYLVMELISGGNLRGYLEARGMLPPGEAVHYMAQVADALHYAHDRGVIHRDIKPENILLKPVPPGTRFEAKLTDFGLAKVRSSLKAFTQTSHIAGTYPYMSPEQFAGQIDESTDIYALGVVLYETTVGRRPFNPTDAKTAYDLHTKTPPPLPITLNPNFPVDLQDVIMKCLEKHPKDRFASGRALQTALKALRLDAPAITDAPKVLSGFDQIIVKIPQQPALRFSLDKEIMILGRDRDVDLRIDDPYISRRHLQIRRTPDNTYWVKDIDPLNPSRVHDSSLNPYQEQQWNINHTLYVGQAEITLQPSTPSGILQQREDDFSLQDAGGLRRYQPLEVRLEPPNLRVAPGATSGMTVILENNGTQADEITLIIRGVPGGWCQTLEQKFPIQPGKRVEKVIRFSPPYNWQINASRHFFTLRVISELQGTEAVKRTGVLHIEPFQDYTLELHPQRLRDSGVTTLNITNNGNVRIDFLIAAQDPEDGLQFMLEAHHVQVEPGATRGIRVAVQPRQIALVHGAKLFPFHLRVSTPNGGERLINGELIAIADRIAQPLVPVIQSPMMQQGTMPEIANPWDDGANPMLDYANQAAFYAPAQNRALRLWLIFCGVLAAGLIIVMFNQAGVFVNRSSERVAQGAYLFLMSTYLLFFCTAIYQAWYQRVWAEYGLMIMLLFFPFLLINALPWGIILGIAAVFLSPVGWFIIQAR